MDCRLIKHTERLLEEKEEKLCIKVLQTLKEMMTVDIDYGEKVSNINLMLLIIILYNHFDNCYGLFITILFL